MNMQKPLTMIAVKVNVSPSLTEETEITTALGEAAKGISRNVRGSDAIYSLAHGVFGLLLPETEMANAKRIELRIEQELRAIGMPDRFGFEITVCTYPGQVESAHEMEDVVSSLLPQKQVWEEIGSSR
jgi:GGDEF domain-containing protein